MPRSPIDFGKKERIINALANQPEVPRHPTPQEIGAKKKSVIIEKLAAQSDIPSQAETRRLNRAERKKRIVEKLSQ